MPKIQLIRNSTSYQNALTIAPSLLSNELKNNEVRIKIISTTVLHYDRKVIEGSTTEVFPIGYDLGTSATGTIVDLAPNVSGFDIGDNVLIVRHPRFQGVWKNETVVPVSCICHAPETQQITNCVSLGYGGNIAMSSLYRTTKDPIIKHGNNVVIIGTLNTVCFYIAQLALYSGAKAVTIVTRESHPLEEALKIDNRISIQHIGVELFTKFDIMIALDVEWHSYLNSLKEGAYVSVFSSHPPLNVIEKLNTNNITWEYKPLLPNREFMEYYTSLIDDGVLHLPIQTKKQEFNLKNTISSLQSLERNLFIGDIVLFNKN